MYKCNVLIIFKRLYLFERKKEIESRGRIGGRGGESPTDSTLGTEPIAGFDPMILRSCLSQNQGRMLNRLSHSGTPVMCL